MPTGGTPHSYNLRSAEDTQQPAQTVQQVLAETIRESVQQLDPVEGNLLQTATMATFKLEVFRGDETDRIEDFIKRFDQYTSIVGMKKEQHLDVLFYHLEGRARWFIDTVKPQPKTVEDAKKALENKFKQEVKVKLNVFNMKKMSTESINDFIYTIEKDTHHMSLPENVRVKIALEGLDSHICSAISSHGPKTLDEVRELAGRVETTPPPHVPAATPDTNQNQLAEIMTMMRQMWNERTPRAGHQQESSRPQSQQQQRPQPQQQQHGQQQQQQQGQCMRCGRSCFGKTCPAWGKTCFKCNKMNHFKSVCRGVRVYQNKNQ